MSKLKIIVVENGIGKTKYLSKLIKNKDAVFLKSNTKYQIKYVLESYLPIKYIAIDNFEHQILKVTLEKIWNGINKILLENDISLYIITYSYENIILILNYIEIDDIELIRLEKNDKIIKLNKEQLTFEIDNNWEVR